MSELAKGYNVETVVSQSFMLNSGLNLPLGSYTITLVSEGIFGKMSDEIKGLQNKKITSVFGMVTNTETSEKYDFTQTSKEGIQKYGISVTNESVLRNLDNSRTYEFKVIKTDKGRIVANFNDYVSTTNVNVASEATKQETVTV
jgi:hypothetical protein